MNIVSNITGAPVSGSDLFGRDQEIMSLWERIESGQHVLMLAPRRVGKTSLMHEMARAPRPGWVVIYIDLEGDSDEPTCLANMISRIATNPATRTWFEAAIQKVPFRTAIIDILKRLKISIPEVLTVEIKSAIGSDWREVGNRFRERLAHLPDNVRVLFILDELPILVSRILDKPDGNIRAADFLNWLRSLRQDQDLRGKVAFLSGGSIGLNTLVQRHNLSGTINDLTLFEVSPWSHAIATEFLKTLGDQNSFPVGDELIEAMIVQLGEAIPYHVQLLYFETKILCQSDPNNLSPQMIRQAFEDRLSGPAGTPHLNHYAERLEQTLGRGATKTAFTLLDRTCQSETGVHENALADLRKDSPDQTAQMIELLVGDGYLERSDNRLLFRSNLIREHWRKHQAPRRPA